MEKLYTGHLFQVNGSGDVDGDLQCHLRHHHRQLGILCTFSCFMYCSYWSWSFSGICCNLKSFWIIPCQSWQWTRSGGIVKTVDFRIRQILKSTFVNILHLKDFELVDGADLDLETPWTRSANRRSFSSPFSSCDAISSPQQFDSNAWIGI